MCFFGGGGGDPAAEQRRIQQERQANIDRGLSAVDSAFDDPGRAGLADRVYQSAYDANLARLEDDYSSAQRAARFATARGGQSGGSAAVEREHELTKRRDEGLVRAASLAEEQRQRLRSQDENTRRSLIDQVYGGLGATQAGELAGRQLQLGTDSALRASQDATLGDLFANLAASYTGGRALSGRLQAQQAYGRDQFNSYNATPGGSGYAGALS